MNGNQDLGSVADLGANNVAANNGDNFASQGMGDANQPNMADDSSAPVRPSDVSSAQQGSFQPQQPTQPVQPQQPVASQQQTPPVGAQQQQVPPQPQMPQQSQMSQPAPGPSPDKDQNVYNFLVQIIQEKYGTDIAWEQITPEADRLYDELGDLLVRTFEGELTDEQKEEFNRLAGPGMSPEAQQTYLLQNITNLEQRIQQILIDFRQRYLTGSISGDQAGQ